MIDLNWYAVSIAGILAVLLIYWASRRAVLFYPCLRFFILSRMVYPLLIHRRRWTSITYMEFVLLGVYVVVNGVYMGVDGTSELMRRSIWASSINIIILFLGGRTNALIDALGIPLHTYYLLHHWIGRIAVTQALLHAGLAISSRKWAFDSQTISGLFVAILLTLILLTSLYFIRGIAFEWFLITHVLLALTVIGGTIWHILPGEFTKLLFPIISISVWSITTIFWLVWTYRSRGGYISSCNSFSQPGLADPRLCAVKFNFRIPRHLDVDPGQYLYLYFSGLRRRYRFQGHPFMIMWCEYGVEVIDGKRIDITNLTFLVQPRDGLTASLGGELQLRLSDPSKSPSPVSFDGPYGQDLHLERYETVMLVAKGPGIAGVLRYAQHLAQRSRYDTEIKKLLKQASTPNKGDLRNSLYRDATRKVDLFWKLDLNGQEEWISDHILALQDLDPGRRTNLIYCYYPETKIKEPLMKLDKGWRCFYPGDPQPTLDAVIEEEAGKLRRNIVVTCGNATFTRSIRRKVLEIMSKDNIIEFVEVEYHPQGFGEDDDDEPQSARLLRKRQNTRVTKLPDAEIELERLPTRVTRNVLSKAPGMQVMGRVHEKNNRVEDARVRGTAFV